MLSYPHADRQPKQVPSGAALGLEYVWKIQPYHRINLVSLVVHALAVTSRGQRSGVRGCAGPLGVPSKCHLTQAMEKQWPFFAAGL